MSRPPITRFTSLAINPVITNKNNGMYAPRLNAEEIKDIPPATLVNGGILYDSDTDQLKAVINGKLQNIGVGPGVGDVIGPNISVDGNITIFDGTTGKLIKDSGASIAKVAPEGRMAINATETLSFLDGEPVDPVIELGNLGHIKFSNGAGFIFVDGDIPVGFTSVDFGTGDHVCSVFTGGLARPTSTVSALVEIHSSDGALLLSRMSTVNRDLLKVIPGSGSDGANGMLLFNTTTIAFNGFDGTNWREFALFNTDGALNLNSHKLLNVTTPTLVTDGANKGYVDAAVSGIPTAIITLTGNVTGSGLVSSPIVTTLNMSLDQITAPAANLSLNSHKIISLLDPTLAQDGATKNYVDTRAITLSGAVTGTGALGTTIATTLTNITISQISNLFTARLDQFAAPNVSVSLGSQKIINLLNPTLAQDGATKNYVDTSIAAPAAAKFIIQTTNSSVANAQSLGSLTTGLLLNTVTTSTGVLSRAVPGTDYYSPGNPTRILDNGTNFFIGTGAGNLASFGINNTGVGINALTSLVSNTSNNSAFGYSALTANTSGFGNSALGTGALSTNTTASYNSAFGYFALGSNTAANNSAFGYLALAANTTGTSNSAFGYIALTANTLGNKNSAFGIGALGSNTTGSSNSAFGFNVLAYNITGVNNSAFGESALAVNTSSSNSAFGYLALTANTTGPQNSAFGTSALSTNTTGDSNTAFGFNALQLNSTAANNSAFGTSALAANTGANNTASGTGALLLNTTGASNAAFGYLALATNTTGSNNSVFGTSAGTTRSVYTNCVFLGREADASVNNLTNAIAIGYQASVSASNCMVLGGTGANQLFVGIGVNPHAELQLSQSIVNRKIVMFESANNDHEYYGLGINAGVFRCQLANIGSAYVFYAGTSSITSNELMRIMGIGRVGIGTAAPDQLLTVATSTPSKITSGSWAAYSDARIKEVLGDYKHGLSEIIKVKTRRFKYNDKSGYPESEKSKTHVGVIAQEIEDIFPECITEKMQKGDIPDMRMFDGTALTYALINAVKELNNEIINLKQQIKR